MGIFISIGVFTLAGVIGLRPWNTGVAPGLAFRFGSLDFIADTFSKLHLGDSALGRSMKASPSSPLGPLHELGALTGTITGQIAPGSRSPLEHGSSPNEQEPRMVTMIKSLLPVLSYNTDDDESSRSHYPSQEVFIVDQGTTVVDNNLSALIAEQTPKELEVTRLQLQVEREWLDEQHAELARQHEDRERVEAMWGRRHQVNRSLGMFERDGVC